MKTIKILSAIGLTFAVSMTLAWLGLNLLMGCGLVNDWSAPECMTPFEIINQPEGE